MSWEGTKNSSYIFSSPLLTSPRAPQRNSSVLPSPKHKWRRSKSLTIIRKLWLQVIDIAKKYTNKSDEREAVQAFRKILDSRSMWHNNGSFPVNESNEYAYKTCVDPETAAKYCPVRWKAVNK